MISFVVCLRILVLSLRLFILLLGLILWLDGSFFFLLVGMLSILMELLRRSLRCCWCGFWIWCIRIMIWLWGCSGRIRMILWFGIIGVCFILLFLIILVGSMGSGLVIGLWVWGRSCIWILIVLGGGRCWLGRRGSSRVFRGF